MNIKSFSPHSASSVTEIRFYLVTLPDNVTDETDLEYPLAEYPFEDVLTQFTDVLTYSDDQTVFYYQWKVDDTQTGLDYLVNSEWNVMAFFEDDALLSMAWWDENIPATDRKFNNMLLEYSSTSVIVSSENNVDIISEYASHVTEEARYSGSATVDEIHPIFEGRVYKERDSGFTLASFTQNSDWTTEQLAGSADTSNSYFEATTTGAFNYHFIPSVTSENAILFTSPWIGAGYYDPDDGMVYAARDFQGPSAPDGWEDMGEMRVYNYSIQIFLFYFPELCRAYISCQNADETWQTPWQVASTGINSSSVKIIVPTYFSIVPLLFMYINGNVQLVHILNLTEDSDYLDINYNATQPDPTATAAGFQTVTAWQNHTESNDTRARVVHTMNYLLSTGGVDSIIYLQAYLWDELLGYGDQKEEIAQYWLNQYYISYTTLMQAIRYYPEYDVDILDCGIRCFLDGERTIFLPYTAIDFSGDAVPLITLPEGAQIDNMLYYSDGMIRSIQGEDSYDVSSYSAVQMRNGIIVGYNGSQWEGIYG